MIRIREVLKDRNIGIKELADRMGVNRQTIYYYIEQDDKNPVSQLQKIADAIGCDLMDLIEEKGKELTCPHCNKPIKIKITE